MNVVLLSVLALGLAAPDAMPLGLPTLAQEICADDGQKSASENAAESAAVRSELRIASRNLMRGITFKMAPDGKVEVTVREEDKETGRKDLQTYTADSIEDFKCRYPEVAEKIDLHRLAPKTARDANGVAESWEEWRKRFDREWFWEEGVGKFLKPWMPLPPSSLKQWWSGKWDEIAPAWKERGKDRSPVFGVRVEPVARSLAAQLRLEAGVGLLVSEVQSGSPAEKAGLKTHDVLLKVNGSEIRDCETLRKQVRELRGTGFDLEVVREGTRQTIRVNPETSSAGL